VELTKDSFLRVSLIQFEFNSSRKRLIFCAKPSYTLLTVQPLVTLCVKLSFFIYFLHIFTPKAILRWSIFIGAFITTAAYIACTIIRFVLSTPPLGVTLAEQFMPVKTFSILNTTFALGYFNIFSDLFILVLPISGVMGLNLAPRQKFGVVLIFMTGLL
jgi:hypothetical protein